ncbi:zinc finger protein 469 [Labeo rohita]|uniref:Zinc finger protein 469 n=1 Tax=Labeo rohita TaxID=84645 RepID=A0A498M1B1_LABRO|nr:zinc finger protein 469 [Labeo rohita]
MTEETKQPLAAKELDNESKKQDKGAVEHKSLKKSPEHFHNVSLEPQAVNNLAKFAEKERDNTQQREAVIRPQQAGKIDFKSLQNHSFSSNRTWPSGKDSPQSPSGKSRNRDKSKKSGKGERGNPQQLYRLSITNPRSNPTIGIAYPQQKVSPPKKIESSRGPVSGSYRFHVPSIPEREAELQQEELQFRCFQEGSPNLTSQSYTSQTVGTPSGGPAHQNPPQPQQPQQKPSPIESNSTQPANETLFPDFQLSETDTWQSPDRTFRNTSFGLASQKPNNLVDLNKANGSFMPMPFQYGYPLLEESASDSFPCDRNTQSQDYIDISLAPNQVSHNSFPFPSSAEGHEAMQTNAQFGNDQVEDRQSYQLHPKPPQYMQTQHGVSSSVPSNDESSSTRPSEQSKSVSDKSDSFSPVDSRDTGFAVVGKRGCHLKNGTTSQRVLIQGSVHHIRNIAQGSSSLVISPPHNGIHISPGPLDKSVSKHHVRVSHPWEGPNKAFPPPLIDQNSTPYPFPYQPAPEQRQNSINGRMPWQQIRFTTAMPNQNRIDLSRQLSNQQLTFLIGPSDWQDDSKPHKNSNQKDTNNFLSKKTTEGFSNQRQDSVKQGCNTIPPCHFTNKVDTNQGQVGDAKNKSLYFGINHSVPVTSSRNCSFPPLHVAPLGLKMVSPYDSPSHSPTQNPASSSTCSSLSPASTNSVNSNSEDSQISKVLSPQFYQQQQDKALIASTNMNTNQHHYLSEASRGLQHYKQEKTKENIASFMSHNRHSKSNMDNGKGCLETYRTENHPPPPYSAHQLATSLVSANLDQLDVLLTCKQCDQNFNNLVSFLDHKQYCGQHTFAQNDFKDVPKVEDVRKFQTDHTKAMSSGSSYTILRSSSDLHLSLLGLNKNGEIVPDNETKGDIKDDPMKLMLPSAPLPDLEMEDPKLDSLITEALNGLGYQSDNAEIDSSFIDAFVDDDLTTTKCTSTRQTLTTKDSTTFEGRTNNESTSNERSQAHSKYPFDSDLDSLSSDSKLTDSPFKESQHELIQKEGLKAEASPTESQSQESNCTQIEWETRKSEQREEEDDYSSKFLLSSKFSARCGLKSLQSSTALVKTTSTCASKSPTAQKPMPTEGKRKRTGGGSWSKELIHKIVQQKNKLHKLHVKGTKNMQFSLVMERVTPAVQNPTFREYDYVSDSDDDCEPVKIASQGRLSQSIRCKYTYTKECKGRIRADKSRESSWKQNKNECFDPKKALDVSPSLMKDNPGHQRLRRRSSRSSTSSELSTSISICSDSISSPKSTDHTDSDSEKRIEVQRKDQDSLEQNVYEESPARIRKESSTSLALTFTKNTKRYSTDKILLTEHKDRFTTSKCSSIICKTEETASEHTMTKSTVSLARFKTTRVEIEEKGDHYGFEAGMLATTEEPFKKDHPKNITSPKGSGIAPNPMESTNNRDSSHVLKLKKDSVTSKGKSHKKRTNSSEFSAPIFEKASNDSISSEEASGSSNDLFPDPPPLCNSLVDKVCLSPSKVHDATAQKNGQCLIPYPSEHDQSLIKSPLSFDTSSMFGDLSVGGFENNLYPDIQLAKESFSPLETTTDKKELFESSFSPFLEQRDWNLVDVTPVLPDEISQYKEDSDSNENKTNFNHVPFALPEKLMDYNPNLNSSVSVDDLEIKRIVTELESQLQTAKLSSPPPLDSELPKQLTMSKFSPLRLDPDSEDDDSSLEMNCSSENLQIARPVDSQSALFSEPDLPWSSPLPFGLMCGQQGLHTPTHTSTINTPTDSEHDHLDIKDSMGLTVLNAENGSPAHLVEKTEKNDYLDKSEEMLEHEIYTENLMKSLEVISDSLSSGFTSPQSSPNQESVVPEEHEKQDSEHSEQNESEHMESRNAEAELTKFSAETNTAKPEETASDISGYHKVNVGEEQKSIVVRSEEQMEETTTSAGHSILHKKGDPYDIDDVVTKYCSINPKYVQTEDIHYPLEGSSVNIKHENTCSPAEDNHALTGTLGIEPDLKAFFDDESTFSQLFPRNDDRKRKKCARVYGKSNKKQKQLSCLMLDCPPTGAFIDTYEESKENKMGHKFTSEANDVCEYKTIEMTPKSLVKSSIENAKDDLMDNQAGYEENIETGIKEFLCEKEGTIEHQENLHDCIVPENIVPQEDCKSEVPATPCPLQMVCVQENASCLPSTEIPNLTTPIQISVPFFEPEGDMPLVETIASTELKDPERPCKKPVERKCRKRIEPGLKPKDKQYKCKVCFTWFLTLGELDFHKLSHNPSPPPTCYMCVQRKFSSREQLRDHLREKHAKNKAGVWTCGMCLKEISDVWMYNEHLREHATQFARRGQSQSSLLDMPGCFMQENAVKNFISSIMQHRPSRTTKADNLKSSKEERRTSLDVNGQELKVPEEFDSTSLKTKTSTGGGSKHCALTTLEVLPKAETPSKNAEMHPNCKDPSRDCHHCGKQFPKPFKLQRHLVVHSLQKIFLCHKCPVSYQEAKELKDHLKNEHEETDEPDSKHTTLYTCELCADVMHVIKKSFICSTCNYTFSKKEQFDRHMEKHLAGGNKIFKFRGVMRPCKPFSSKDDISDMPPSKKRKATESSLDITASHMQGIKSVLPIIDDTAQNNMEDHSTETNNTSVKIEDEDFPEVAKDIIECTVQTDSADPSLTSTELKEEDESPSPSHEIQVEEPGEVSATDKGALTEICDVKIEDDCCTTPSALLDSEINTASISRQNEDRVETNPSYQGMNEKPAPQATSTSS